MSERREFFRMPMEAKLHIQLLNEAPGEVADPADEFPASGMLKIMAELKRLDGEGAQLHPQIKDSDRALGEYLHIVSRKIDVLAQYCMTSQMPEDVQQQTVTLSEGGLSFSQAQAFALDQWLALHMVFTQPPMATALFAKVTRCEPDRDKGFAIGAEFHYTGSGQRQQISQHMMRAQMDSIRRQPKK